MDKDKAWLVLLAATMVNAKYSALTFFQGQKGSPLEDDEIREIATVVNNRIGEEARAIADLLRDISFSEE